VFLPVLLFPLSVIILPLLHTHLSSPLSSGSGTKGLYQVAITRDSLTSPRRNIVKKQYLIAASPNGRSNTGIVGLNLARGIDVCPRFSVVCFPVQVEALRRADPLSKESYKMSK
jgi:hypothetical protein